MLTFKPSTELARLYTCSVPLVFLAQTLNSQQQLMSCLQSVMRLASHLDSKPRILDEVPCYL